MKVIVIGCGPAGLAAAHAAVGLGAKVVIYGPGIKSPQRGPLLIQRSIPGITTGHPDGTIHQIVIGGSILDYRYRLYGDVNIGINGDMLKPQYHAWKHPEAYDNLWERYSGMISRLKVSPSSLRDMHLGADLVVSTANAQKMCTNYRAISPHRFRWKEVAVTSSYAYPEQPDNTIIFNAGQEYRWVRSSRVFGVPATEWRVRDAPEDAVTIRKPISTDCTCYPHVLRTGRFGAWRNETWVDTAYWDTYNAIVSMNRAPELELIK